MDKIKYWLILNNAAGLGPILSARLLSHFGHAEAVCNAREEELRQFGLTAALTGAIKNPNESLIEQQCAWAHQPHNYIIPLDHPYYPTLLKNIPDPPIVLFVQGHPEILIHPQIAMVGSRNPSPGGIAIAEQLAENLTRAGMIITSGLAVGIDGACHRGALKGEGLTIAVLGSGLQRLYPMRHQQLAVEIARRGALVSEFPPEMPPLAGNFPRRNRIISGLSLGTCIVEATVNSGSLITARLAAEQGREVFAVPGSIFNPLARGCHFLIQEGAKLVTEEIDILMEVQWQAAQDNIKRDNGIAILELDPSRHQLLKCIGFECTSVDQLVQRSGYQVDQVTAMLPALEWQGFIHAVTGGYVRIK